MKNYQRNIDEGGLHSDDKPTNSNRQLERSQDYQEQYNEWKNSEGFRKLMERLYNAYTHKENGDDNLQLNPHNSPGADAISISEIDDNDPQTFRFLMDYMKEQVIEQNYRPYSSTIEHKSIDDRQLVFERHYLKPNVFKKDKPAEQLYGNVLIELEFAGEEVKYLKLLSTYYTGYDYKPAMQFNDLIVRVFSA